MKRKVLITISGRNYTVEIDDDLDLSLRRILKNDYQFNNEGILNLEEKNLSTNYQVKQLLLYKLLMAMPENRNEKIAKRLNEIESFTHPRSIVYHSDLQELERIYIEASGLYNDILAGKYPEQELNISKSREDSGFSRTSQEGLESSDDSSKEQEKSNIDVEAITESTAKVPTEYGDAKAKEESEYSDSSTEDTADSGKGMASDIKAILHDAATSPELSAYITPSQIEEVAEKIQVAATPEEFTAKTSVDAHNLNIQDYVRKVSDKPKIILPPLTSSSNAEDIALDVYTTLNHSEPVIQAVNSYKERRQAFNNKIQNSFNTLRSSFKLKGGINSRNLNAFGNDFLASYMELCRETGTNPEEMFKEYFSSSASVRGNSVLDKFITQFIRANGGDESLRDLIETTLVKKAIASNLVSAKYNSYLKDGYRELSFNRNGAINFDFKNEVAGDASAQANVTANVSGNFSSEATINGQINSNINVSSEMNAAMSIAQREEGIGPSQVNTNLSGNRPHAPIIPKVPNVNGKITQNIPGANLNEGAATAGARTDLEKLNAKTENGLAMPPQGVGSSLNVPVNDNLNPNVGAAPILGAPSGANASLGVGSAPIPSMGLREQGTPHNNKFAQNQKNGNKKGKASPLGLINNRDKNLRQRRDRQDLITGSGLRKNNLMNPHTMNELENNAELENDLASNNYGVNDNNSENNTKKGTDDRANVSGLPNKSEDSNASNQNESNPVKNAVDNLKKEGKKKIGEVILTFIKKNPWVLAIVGIFLIIFLLLTMGGGDDMPKMTGLGGYSYLQLANPCEEIYVYDTPSGVDGTYPLEEYVAGVVAHEVGAFNNDTLYEVFAIAARTYALNRLKNSNSCSIKGDSTAQVFGKTDNERIIAAANNTRGLVLTRNANLISTEYDAFCWDTKDDNYYNICQKNYDTDEILKVPIDWAEEHVAKISGRPFLENARYHSHGRGMSQDGAWYMAEELGYDKDKILTFFYGSTSKIMSIYASTYSGEFPLNPSDELYQNLAFLINESFDSLLTRNGTNVEEFNAYLENVAKSSGLGTREAVVNTAVSLIGSLANMGYKLNYDWGGRYDYKGVNANWGVQFNPTCNSYPGGKSYCYTNHKWHSFDCNGFVNWALLNGFGLNNLQESTKKGIYQKTQTANATRVNLNPNQAVCKSGDVMIKPGSHIVLVVGINEKEKKYIVAESTGSNVATKQGGVKLTYYSYNASGYFCGDMSSIYNNNEGDK